MTTNAKKVICENSCKYLWYLCLQKLFDFEIKSLLFEFPVFFLIEGEEFTGSSAAFFFKIIGFVKQSVAHDLFAEITAVYFFTDDGFV